MTDHQEIELGRGVFEPFIMIERASMSAVQSTVAASIAWLHQALRFAAAAGDGTAACTVAVYDADTQEVTLQWHASVGELAELIRRLV